MCPLYRGTYITTWNLKLLLVVITFAVQDMMILNACSRSSCVYASMCVVFMQAFISIFDTYTQSFITTTHTCKII